MDDKKFDEIMHKYVSGKTRGMEADFSKFNERKEEKIIKKHKNKLLWAAASCVAVIAIVLSIVLPVTLTSSQESGDDTQTSNIQYLEEQEVALREVAAKDDIALKYNITASLPAIKAQGAIYCILLNKANDNIIGAFIDLSIFDENFDFVNMHIVSQNTVWNMLVDYESLAFESSWNDSNVKFLVEHDEESGSNYIRIFFVMDGYKYYLNAQYYGELNVEEILDLIF